MRSTRQVAGFRVRLSGTGRHRPQRPVLAARWQRAENSAVGREVTDEKRACPPTRRRRRSTSGHTYLLLLRDQAAVDGALPDAFDALLREVFGELAADRP